MTRVAAAARARPVAQPLSWVRDVVGYLYAAPNMVFLVVFTIAPVVASIVLSLQAISPFGTRTIWVGLENYGRLLQDPSYWNSIKVTLIFAFGTMVPGLIIATLLAVLLNQRIRGLGVYRFFIFMPVVISTAIAGVVWTWLFNPVVGFVNYLLSFVGISGPSWLASSKSALWAVIVTTVWKELGFNTIIALAGVQNIDQTYYDAAQVDGANALQKFWNVTIPLLSPTLFFLLIINMILSFQAFGQIHVLTQGGPASATTTLIYSIYEDAFIFHQRGFASAQAYVLALILFAITLIQWKGLERKVTYQ